MKCVNIRFFLFFASLFLFLSVHAENELPVNWQGLPEPYATESAVNPSQVINRPEDAKLIVPESFKVEEYLSGFIRPRYMIQGKGDEIILSDIAAGAIYTVNNKETKVLIRNLNKPYGLALHKQWLYVADVNEVRRYIYDAENRTVDKGESIISLRKYATGHITRTILFDEPGEKLYLSIGSRSNVDAGEPQQRAAISRYNPDGTGLELFATGIRNGVGMTWNPESRKLWVTSHERDGLGDDLVPDFLTEVQQGGFYGWPYSYIGQHEDPRRKGEAPDLVKKSLYPSVLLGGHVGAMDVLFYTGDHFPEKYRNGAFVALHGSWNRSRLSGYKIVFVPFKEGKALSGPEDFLTGWMVAEDRTDVWGRPVGLLQMRDGSLLVSDDGAGKIWRISYSED